MSRYAVIDLGTNTFHMLIVEKAEGQIPFREIHRERRFVKLAEDGIETIGSKAFERGLQTLIEYRKILDQKKVTEFRACGTAALRTASNGQLFVQQALEKANISIRLIDGDTEARLIQRGVALTLPTDVDDRYMIMDIGGGSVEFIICEKESVFWAQSFPVGAAVLYKNFHHSDPMAVDEVAALYEFLEHTLQPLLLILKKYPTTHLVGASGTFDVLGMKMVDMQSTDLSAELPVDQFAPFFNDLLYTTVQERYIRQDIPDARADMIVVALILIDFIIKKAPVNRLAVSSFAMKEGILTQMLLPN
ncbi:MAG: exopolyphosphatase [Saprospiraceae bacterium]